MIMPTSCFSWHPRQDPGMATVRLTYIRGHRVSVKGCGVLVRVEALHVWTKSNVDKLLSSMKLGSTAEAGVLPKAASGWLG